MKETENDEVARAIYAETKRLFKRFISNQTGKEQRFENVDHFSPMQK